MEGVEVGLEYFMIFLLERCDECHEEGFFFSYLMLFLKFVFVQIDVGQYEEVCQIVSQFDVFWFRFDVILLLVIEIEWV